MDELIDPFAEARDRLDTITGVGKQAAESIIAEIGVDMSVLPTAGHLCSWAGLCPVCQADVRHLLSDNCDYDDLGGDYFVTRDTDRTRQRAVSQLQALGYRVTLEPTAAA